MINTGWKTVEHRISTVIVILLLLGAEVCFGFIIKETKYFAPYVWAGSVVSFILVIVVCVNFCISKNNCEMRDIENSTNEGSEYDWNKGLAIAFGIHKCGESSEGVGDVEYKSTVLERGNNSGRVEDDAYEGGDEYSVCELGESSGREGDVSFKSSVLEEGDSRGHLGQRIYQVIREGGYSSGCDISETGLNPISGCDISETGHNPIGEESAVYNDEARTYDIPLFPKWSNFLKATSTREH